MKEVSTMTAQAFSHPSNTTIVRNGVATNAIGVRASDVLIQAVALRLLAWSERRAAKRAVKNQLTHERMALILENQRSATRGGSSLGR
jgi:hypothetical protein